MSEFNFQGETEQSLVAALRQGKQEVLGKLYDAYAPVMMGVIARIVQNEEVAEEVLKETFVAIWSRIGVYDSSKDRLLTWGLAIARGMALEAVKTNRYTIFASNNSHAAAKQADRYSLQPLCHLDPQEKTALELIYLKGRTCTETAAELDITEEHLRSILKKAFIHLRTEKPA